jgi:hypothetical protein
MGRFRLLLLAVVGCTPTVSKPPVCPKPKPCASAASGAPARGPSPPQLDGTFEVVEVTPKGLPPAPPETYLLGPSERESCAFVRLVLTFQRETLAIRYDTLCVDREAGGREAGGREAGEREGGEPEASERKPVPLNWCTSEGVALVDWDARAFSLPAGAATRASVQRVLSYAPGTNDGLAYERIEWGCKFALDPQSFEIVDKTDDKVRLRAPKYEAEWLLERTRRRDVDPDDVIRQLRDKLHPKSP